MLDDVLLGSSTIPAVVKIGAEGVQLGALVALAQTASGLSAAEWNAMPDDERDLYIADEIDKARAKASPSGVVAKVEDVLEKASAKAVSAVKAVEGAVEKLLGDEPKAPALDADQLGPIAEIQKAAETVEAEVKEVFSETAKCFKAVINTLHDPYQRKKFDTSDGAMSEETPWVKAQVQAGLLVEVPA